MKGNSKLVALFYCIFCFYNLGQTLMTYFVNYAELAFVKENFTPVMTVFNDKMWFFSTLPAILTLFITIVLLWQTPKYLTKWMIFLSVGLTTVYVIVNIWYIQPIHASMIKQGFLTEILSLAFNFQVIPAVLQSLLALWLLNEYFAHVKPLARWSFLIVFILAWFTMGTGTIESFVAYPIWREVGANDWLAFRGAVTAPVFFGIYLIPGYLPMILAILMFWFRPVGIPRWSVGAIIGLIIIVFVVTAIYFVPDIQMQLDKAYSQNLIDDLIKNDFLYRGWAAYLYVFLTAWMFMKVETV
jgi:hypothetical protein